MAVKQFKKIDSARAFAKKKRQKGFDVEIKKEPLRVVWWSK